MIITDILDNNARLYADEVALVEINPMFEPQSRITWRDYALMQPEPGQPFRREITWEVFNEKANRLANMLTLNGIGKGKKVAIELKWKNPEGADGCFIGRRNDFFSQIIPVAKLKGESFTDEGIVSGQVYHYSLQCFKIL